MDITQRLVRMTPWLPTGILASGLLLGLYLMTPLLRGSGALDEEASTRIRQSPLWVAIHEQATRQYSVPGATGEISTRSGGAADLWPLGRSLFVAEYWEVIATRRLDASTPPPPRPGYGVLQTDPGVIFYARTYPRVIVWLNIVSSGLVLIVLVLGTREWQAALRARLNASADSTQQPQDLGELLGKEVAAARETALDLRARSTLALVAGLGVACLGVAVFYATLPDTRLGTELGATSFLVGDGVKAQPADTLLPLEYLARSVRPLGMLLAIEMIAWFLLRQYRSLIEDYKYFHRVFLWRWNQLAAVHLIQDRPDTDAPGAATRLLSSLLSPVPDHVGIGPVSAEEKEATPIETLERLLKIVKP